MHATRCPRPGLSPRCLAFLFLATTLAASCAREPLRIGVSLVLTGPSSRIGVTARNGIELAAGEINAAGGIRGRKLELLVRDDLDTPEGAVAADEELRGEGVLLVIGHMSSRSGTLAIPLANEKGSLLLSPTISSEDWTGKDDWFFRAIGSNSLQGKALAAHALRAGLRRVAATYEYSNRSYTKNVFDSFIADFRAGGGELLELPPFTQGPAADHAALAKALLAGGPDAILSVAGAVDNARLCQELERAGSRIPVYAGMWSTTDDLFRNGGNTVGRVVAVGTMDLEDRSPSFTAFLSAYRERFGEDPGFASLHGHDSLRMAAAAIERCLAAGSSPSPAAIKAALLSLGDFPGLQSVLHLDAAGDCDRPYRTFTVREGAFRRAD